MNDICNCSKLFKFILFADNTNIFYSSETANNFVEIVNCELAKLAEWFRANKLSLNLKKTHFILFGNKSKSILHSNPGIKIEGNVIERVSSTKFLGVYLDENLNWKQHALQISMKVSKSIGVLYRIKHILTHDLLQMLYYTLIHPYFLYCNIIWGSASMAALNNLVLLQKRAVRLISKSEFRAHSSPIFKRLRILKLADINTFQTLVFMYKIKNNLLPTSSFKHVHIKTDNSLYNLRKDRDFIVEKYKTVIRKKSIAVFGPDLWHPLSDAIKSASSVIIFKRLLTDSLIDCYYGLYRMFT